MSKRRLILQMAKKVRGFIKNAFLLKGKKTQPVKDTQGRTQWAETRKKEVLEGNTHKATVEQKIQQIKSSKELSATQQKPVLVTQKSVKQADPAKITKGAEKIVAGQRDIKPAKTTPPPAKKPPVPGR